MLPSAYQRPYGGLPERPKGADCKSAALRFAGSNPAPATSRTRISTEIRVLLGSGTACCLLVGACPRAVSFHVPVPPRAMRSRTGERTATVQLVRSSDQKRTHPTQTIQLVRSSDPIRNNEI